MTLFDQHHRTGTKSDRKRHCSMQLKLSMKKRIQVELIDCLKMMESIKIILLCRSKDEEYFSKKESFKLIKYLQNTERFISPDARVTFMYIIGTSE